MTLMLKKTALLLILFVLSVFIISNTPQASAHRNSPLTSPITAPVTAPITSPMHNGNLMGKVVYKHLGRLFGNISRIIPAEKITVTVRNFFNHNQKYTITTDQQGMYGIQLPKGLYEVRVQDAKHTFFVPPLRVVNIKDSGKTANFEGLIFPRF